MLRKLLTLLLLSGLFIACGDGSSDGPNSLADVKFNNQTDQYNDGTHEPVNWEAPPWYLGDQSVSKIESNLYEWQSEIYADGDLSEEELQNELSLLTLIFTPEGADPLYFDVTALQQTFTIIYDYSFFAKVHIELQKNGETVDEMIYGVGRPQTEMGDQAPPPGSPTANQPPNKPNVGSLL